MLKALLCRTRSIERNQLAATPAFECGRPSALVGMEVAQGGEKKGAEAAARDYGFSE